MYSKLLILLISLQITTLNAQGEVSKNEADANILFAENYEQDQRLINEEICKVLRQSNRAFSAAELKESGDTDQLVQSNAAKYGRNIRKRLKKNKKLLEKSLGSSKKFQKVIELFIAAQKIKDTDKQLKMIAQRRYETLLNSYLRSGEFKELRILFPRRTTDKKIEPVMVDAMTEKEGITKIVAYKMTFQTSKFSSVEAIISKVDDKKFSVLSVSDKPYLFAEDSQWNPAMDKRTPKLDKRTSENAAEIEAACQELKKSSKVGQASTGYDFSRNYGFVGPLTFRKVVNQGELRKIQRRVIQSSEEQAGMSIIEPL